MQEQKDGLSPSMVNQLSRDASACVAASMSCSLLLQPCCFSNRVMAWSNESSM